MDENENISELTKKILFHLFVIRSENMMDENGNENISELTKKFSLSS